MGRRKGSKNKTPEQREAEAAQPKRGRGRPPGSKNRQMVIKRFNSKPQYDPVTGDIKARGMVMHTYTAPRNADESAYNARLIEHILAIHEIGLRADKQDVVSLKSCFIAYLQLCQKNGFNVSNLMAYAAIGMDKVLFQYYLTKGSDEMKQFCKFVRETCSMFREGLISENKLNPVIGIFWQRNFDGLRNDTEQVQNALEQEEDYNTGTRAYKEKYKNLIGE